MCEVLAFVSHLNLLGGPLVCVRNGVDVFYEGLRLCYWRMVECADPGENRYLWRSKTYGCWDNVRRSVGGDWSGLKLALSGAAGNNCP